MSIIHMYRMQCVDEFGRLFYSQYAASDYETRIGTLDKTIFEKIQMQKMVHDILVLMGTATNGTWTCERRKEEWTHVPTKLGKNLSGLK